ncbi:MAG: hypothetical protein L6R38_006646 [Xanthoria sp. 2 TBL-2021]|nr:MAG: hypothetical protein L6R38_006646 [Xanthoria sp. 2 TBL-2021]
MSEKRKPTTRYQGQRPPKRRQLSSPTPPTPAPKQPAPRQAVENAKEELPVKLKESQSLPTRTEVQDPHLPDVDFQSIAESGVLALSIQQSRQRWMTDGIFDRYWTRPTKKKGATEPPNPAKETMVKLGVCSMIIDPHVFEATLYTVREIQSVFMPSQIPPPLPSAPANPAYNPYQDHKTYQQQTQSSYSHGIYPQYHPQYPPNTSNLTLPPFREGFGQYSPSGPSIYHSAASPRPVERDQTRGTAPPPTPPNHGPDPSAIDGEKPTDPVIQMLATRAASDHNLKALMKVVASGHASQEQLRDFQNHIDELNNLIKSQKGPNEPAPDQEPRPQPPPPIQQPQNYSAAPRPPPLPQTPAPASSSPYNSLPPISAHIKAEPPTQSPYFSHLAPPPKPVSPKPDVISLVFDFSPNGDRFTFPRFSILEFLPGRTQVIASFLVIRKGSAAASAPGEYNRNLTYYQPVTIRLSAANPKVLEPLTRVVAPSEEVRKYMNGIFDKMSPAKPAYLVTRLPRGKGDGEVEANEPPVQMSAELVKRLYSPPNSLVPLST